MNEIQTKYLFGKKLRFYIITASIIVIIAGLKAASSILVPFFLAAFIAIIINPVFSWLKSKGIANIVSMLLLLFLLIIIVLFIALFVGTSLKEFSEHIPAYRQQLNVTLAEALVMLDRLGIDLPADEVISMINPSYAMNLAANLLRDLGGTITRMFLILLLVGFMLQESEIIPLKIKHAFSNIGVSDDVDEFVARIQSYLAIKSLTSLATGLCVGISLALLGVNHFLLWGLLAFLFNFIPNVGSILAAIPAILLTIVQLGSLYSLYTALVFLVVNIVIGSIIEPKVMGEGLNLSPLIILLSLIFWGWVFGAVGMLLSIPLTMIIKIALESGNKKHWVGVFLGSGKKLKPNA